jgi:hypothetical protein
MASNGVVMIRTQLAIGEEVEDGDLEWPSNSAKC